MDQYYDESDEPRMSPSKSPQKRHKVKSRYVLSSSEEDQSSVARRRSLKPSGALSDQEQPQQDPDPPYYREVALSDVASQYAEEVDTFRRIISLPDPRKSMPRSSTSVMGLDDEKGHQELRPRGPSSMLPLSSFIKYAFDKFEHDFQAAEGKYIKPPPSTAKWYKVGQPCYEEKLQELNTDFGKICIAPKPPGAPMGKVPLPILKELEHQVTKKIHSQLHCCLCQTCEYFDIWNKTVLIQHRALTCLSKSLAHILQRELYTMGNTGLLRRKAEVTLLQPHLGEMRRQELRNSPFWHSKSLFKSQLVKEGEDFLL